MPASAEIFCCALADIDEELLTLYRSLLNADEQQRLAAYRSPAAAKEFIVGRALLRTELSRRLACDPVDLVFERNADGKPQLCFPKSDAWHFNLSHERDWAVLALSTAGPVGIDVEGHARRNNLAAIAERFFSPEENRFLSRSTEAQWTDHFFAIWTLKEAHAKARGCGLSKILSCSSITLDDKNVRIDFELRDIARSEMPLSGWLYRPAEGVSLAIIGNADTFMENPSIDRVVPLRSSTRLPIAALASGNWEPMN